MEIQKIEFRKWLFYKESFSDYAIDKIVLMKSLKLSDQDVIHLLINGISNLSIKAAAALPKDSLDEFLRKMQYITSCNLKKSSPTFSRKGSSTDKEDLLHQEDRIPRINLVKTLFAHIVVAKTIQRKSVLNSRKKRGCQKVYSLFSLLFPQWQQSVTQWLHLRTR